MTADAITAEVRRRADAANASVLVAAMGNYRRRCSRWNNDDRECRCGNGVTAMRERCNSCRRAYWLATLGTCGLCHRCLFPEDSDEA